MIKEEEKATIKKKIKNNLISADLTPIIVRLLCFLILSGIFGYIGYSFCLDNGYDIQRGIIFAILFPMGIALLKGFNFESKLIYIIYTILFFLLLDYIPTYVGIILLFVIVLLFILEFILVLKEDRTEEIDRIYRQERKSTVKRINKYSQQNKKENEYIKINSMKEKYYCERCFKEISEEEYELYDDMCEECFEETHYDFNGNPREDYWNY